MLTRVLVLAAVVALAPGTAAAQDKEKGPPRGKPAATTRMTDLLAKKITVDAIQNQKFGDAVRDLAVRSELAIVLDPSLTRGAAGAAAAVVGCDGGEDVPVKLPRLVDTRVDTVLRLLCDQADATYLVYPEYIKIAHTTYALYESGVLKTEGTNPDEEPPLLPVTELQKARPLIKRALVSAAYRKVPLREVLDDIAESTGATLVLAPDVGPAAEVPVTARFANTPVDAAVRTLCEVTDLGVIEDANVLVVTTKERAAARAKADAEKHKSKAAPIVNGLCPPPGLGFPNGGALGTGLGDVTGLLTNLQKQNEQLKAELEELKKQLKK